MTMLKTITPIDNSIYVEREYASSNKIENALNLSKTSFQQWKQTSLDERKKLVTNFCRKCFRRKIFSTKMCDQKIFSIFFVIVLV